MWLYKISLYTNPSIVSIIVPGSFLSELTDTLLAAQAFVFFAAGFETSSMTISNALYELALNQELQKKLREEIKEFDTKNSGDWKYETIKQMTYLDKVFKGSDVTGSIPLIRAGFTTIRGQGEKFPQ